MAAFSQSFSAQTPLSNGANSANVSGTDGGNNTKTNGYQVSVSGPANSTLTFDANGNMTSGVSSYCSPHWDILGLSV